MTSDQKTINVDTIFHFAINQDDPGELVYIGDSSSPRKCRFCGDMEGTVTFRKEAHIIPNSFGNRRLFSNEECDTCNEKFGKTLDNDIAAMLAADRALSRLKGSKEITKDSQ